MNKLLEIRNKSKAKKPEFERQDSNIFKQFRGIYRKPKGIHSKMRKGFKGHKVLPTIGYGSPRSINGLTRQGLKPITITNINDVKKIKQGEIIVLSRTLGLKKRIVILQKIKEMKLSVLNIKNIDEFLNKAKENFEGKKKEHKGKQEQRKKAKEEAEKKATEKKQETKEGKVNEPKK